MLRHGSCIRIFHSAKNRITHCLLTDAPRCGVYVGSQWDTPRDRQLTYGNVIAHNRVFRCMNATCDGGAIYLAATNNREDSSNVVDNNLVVDTYNTLPGWQSTPIYTDLQADYTVVKDNLVYDYQGTPVVGAGSRIETNNSWNDGFDLSQVQ